MGLRYCLSDWSAAALAQIASPRLASVGLTRTAVDETPRLSQRIQLVAKAASKQQHAQARLRPWG